MPKSKLSAAIYLVLVFLSGSLVGGFSTRLLTSPPVRAVGPRTPEEWRKRYVGDMREKVKLDDSQLKRAGMDYWQHVTWRRWKSWRDFAQQLEPNARLWFIESGGAKHYAEVEYRPNDYLVFGRETAGLPKGLLEENREHWLRIPMFNPEARSLNLSNCVGLVLYEALRQQGFPSEC